MKKTIMTSILITAVVALMIPSTAMATIGEIKNPPGSILPVPNGGGRAMAYDGLTTLYYTFVGNSNIYMVDTSGISLGPIPNPGPRAFTCGALDFDGTDLLCGTYDGTGAYWKVNPTTGVAVPAFNSAAFGGFAPDNCFNQAVNFIDGVAIDSDGTIWTSDDGGRTLYHVNAVGAIIAAFPMPSTSISVNPGCNSGITVAGNFLELVLLDFEPEELGTNNGDHRIVKVAKDDPTTVIFEFPTAAVLCCEDIAFDANTFAPRAVVWANGPNNVIQAYDVQITRTIGFWKNHADLAPEFLPIDLGDGTNVSVCEVVVTPGDVEDVLNAHKGKAILPKLKAQLLAAKLNVAIGDIPPGDLAAIAIVIADADTLLSNNTCDPNVSKFSALLGEAKTLHSALDAFNNLYSA